MYKVLIDPNVKKFLKRHPELIERFLQSMEAIQKNPFKTLYDTKPLKGKKNHRLYLGREHQRKNIQIITKIK